MSVPSFVSTTKRGPISGAGSAAGSGARTVVVVIGDSDGTEDASGEEVVGATSVTGGSGSGRRAPVDETRFALRSPLKVSVPDSVGLMSAPPVIASNDPPKKSW